MPSLDDYKQDKGLVSRGMQGILSEEGASKVKERSGGHVKPEEVITLIAEIKAENMYLFQANDITFPIWGSENLFCGFKPRTVERG